MDSYFSFILYVRWRIKAAYYKKYEFFYFSNITNGDINAKTLWKNFEINKTNIFDSSDDFYGKWAKQNFVLLTSIKKIGEVGLVHMFDTLPIPILAPLCELFRSWMSTWAIKTQSAWYLLKIALISS